MRVLRRLPVLEAPLRDGRLCLSTAALLGSVLTEENVDEVVARAAYMTKAEVEHLVASIQPRIAPREGIRKLPDARVDALSAPAAPLPSEPASPPAVPAAPASAVPAPSAPVHAEDAHVTATPRDARRTVEVRPVSGSEWSLRVTIGSELKADLETLAALLSHTCGADLAAVLHEAIRCGIEKHGKRKGAAEPARPRATPAREGPATADPRAIPAAVRREVWKRDGGCCTWTGADGRRCGSRWKVEIDHVVPAARGGAPTVANLRLLCAAHNAYHAEQVYGREHMERFRSPPVAMHGGAPRQRRGIRPRAGFSRAFRAQ